MLNTSLAQIFDELGNGLILRGTPIDMMRDDRVPHVSAEQPYELLTAALRNCPARIVVHKSSKFSHDVIEGLTRAATDLRIDSVDLVTVMDSRLRLFREGNCPPYRGTRIEMDERRHLLYTRGSIWYYQTYTGLYIPQPIELRVVRSESGSTRTGRSEWHQRSESDGVVCPARLVSRACQVPPPPGGRSAPPA